MIPKVFFQTAIQPIPQYVLEINQQYLEDWEYKYFSDNDILHFFHTNQLDEYPDIIEKFHSFKGCHKADLFRYYYLYINGGFFMDSDAILCKNINEIVKDRDFISVNSSAVPNSLFQGMIGCTPKHEILRLTLEEAYHTSTLKLKDYHYFCKRLFQIVQPFDVTLFKEFRTEECDEIYDVDIVARHYTTNKVIPFNPPFLHHLYTWGYNYIVFLKNGKMNAFGNGQYKIIDKFVVTATFGKKTHVITFNADYSTFTSVRGCDNEVMIGKKTTPFLQNTLFASYSTPNYSKLTDIYHSSLEKMGATVEHWLEEVDFHEEGFQTDLWYHCVSSKIKNVINVLSKPSPHKYFVFSDCDVHFIHQNKHYWNVLEEFIAESPENIFFMRENDTNQVNTGFFIIKNNNTEMLTFFTRIYSIMQNTPKTKMPLGDQTIINQHLHLIKYNYIPDKYVIWGRNVKNRETSLFHHAVQCGDIESKLEQIKGVLELF